MLLLTFGLLQGSPLSLVRNVCAKALIDLNKNWVIQVLAFIYIRSQNSAITEKSIPVVPRYQISHQSKQGLLWYALGSRAAGKATPAVIYDGAVVGWTDHLRYLWTDLNTYRLYMEKYRNAGMACESWSLWLPRVLNNFTSTCCISMVLSVTDDALGHTTMSQTKS